jgi:tRNA A-37 threonylcarbamoyl transferase component Bud32
MSASPRQSHAHDERLAQLLTQFSEQQRRGDTPDLVATCAANPDLADELQELWAIAQFADLARAASTVTTGAAPVPSVDPPFLALPREFGDFELVSELGRGGMGVVYQARQRSLNRVVALKMVREAHLASDADRARFQGEAEAAARLKHPNIVTVHEVGSSEGQAYFCMEYVDGLTLAEWLAKHHQMPPRDAAKLLADVARAVQHAHEHGILHRDLKPSNILLTSREGDIVPKVTDFGLSKRIDRNQSLTKTGAVVGTPSYMAPEQATGRKELTPAADVYALGVILYELLTGRPPFRASTSFDTILQVLEQEVVSPRDLNPSVDRDIELICLKCLQKPASLRYQSAGELAADLEAYLAGEAVSTRPSGIGYYVSRFMRETHHAEVLENWGVLWMWHSLMIFLLCFATQIMAWQGLKAHGYYLALWSVGLITWGAILWKLRRRAGPVLFVEQQIAHAWAAGVMASISMFMIEVLAGLESLALSPAIAVAAGMVQVFKAGILSGQFYLYAILNVFTAAVMAMIPEYAHLLFGTVSAITFFIPGLKYYRQRRHSQSRPAEV